MGRYIVILETRGFHLFHSMQITDTIDAGMHNYQHPYEPKVSEIPARRVSVAGRVASGPRGNGVLKNWLSRLNMFAVASGVLSGKKMNAGGMFHMTITI